MASSPPPEDKNIAESESLAYAAASPILVENEAGHLQGLHAEVRDQVELERDIARQADQLLAEQALERDQKRLEKVQTSKERLEALVKKLQDELSKTNSSTAKRRLRDEIAKYEVQIRGYDEDLGDIKARMEERRRDLEAPQEDESTGNKRMPHESQRDFLIRTGKITPFSKMSSHVARAGENLGEVLLNAVEESSEDEDEENADAPAPAEHKSHRNLLRPGFADVSDSAASTEKPAEMDSEQPKKKRRLQNGSAAVSTDEQELLPQPRGGKNLRRAGTTKQEDEADADSAESAAILSDEQRHASSSIDSGTELDTDEFGVETSTKSTKINGRTAATRKASRPEVVPDLDDGNEKIYQSRLRSWVERRSAARAKARTPAHHIDESSSAEAAQDDEEEWHKAHPTLADTEYEGGYRIPGDVFPALFDYQKTGTQWLWELFTQQVGGIIGDEMGLGKTIQIIAFLAGLHYSKKLDKPIIVVCPATVMKQWVNEFHTWWPPFRVSILHTSGSGMVDVGHESQCEDRLSAQLYDRARPLATNGHRAAKKIVHRVVHEGHVLVTTYSGLQTYADLLIPVGWNYAVLDEGHKIRNPNTAITVHCKELRTSNRVILSGTPMQNNLVELWSLFDFVFPMRLGTLVTFRNQFEIPIKQGGYANASNLQVQTASRCAEALKDTISPYLLQRFKVDVASDLPKKTEQVLFCKLTRPQREAYERFLNSDEMKSIFNGKRQALFGIDILRKICNHPDLEDHRVLSIKPDYRYGSANKSGKMIVVKELLDLWKRGGHKTLLFSQHRIMLDILEKYLQSLSGVNYRRMDGNTPISARQSMVDEFNNNPDAHVFLLTTKVGGLGINLTGADRVIIFDPDWNPSTDIQARERAWRLGQKREVQIYRLMVAGTIEEKIFHRQIFKQFLTNKILKDPKSRQTFQLKDLHDLFTLGGADEGPTETGRMFQGTEVKFPKEAESPEPDSMSRRNSIRSASDKQDQETLRVMPGIAALEPVESDEKPPIDKDASPPAPNSESRILEGIFARSGVHSALEHDQIINGRRVIAADPAMIEREAKKVAAAAANELRKAESVARATPIGIPTWTGEVGVTGRPAEPRSTARGPSSASILAGLQSRRLADSTTASGSGGGGGSSGSVSTSRASTPAGRARGRRGPRGREFLTLIRDFIATHGGKVPTQMLVDHFDQHCTTAERSAEFKEMLKAIAVMQPGRRGARTMWTLKDEFGW